MFIFFQETASISAHLRKKTTTAWLVACNNFVNLTITTRCAARPRVISQAGSRRSSPEDVTLVTRESYRTTSSRCWASRIKSSICKTWYRWTRIRCFWKKKKKRKKRKGCMIQRELMQLTFCFIMSLSQSGILLANFRIMTCWRTRKKILSSVFNLVATNTFFLTKVHQNLVKLLILNL